MQFDSAQGCKIKNEMRIIKQFPWCQEYGMEKIEVDFDIYDKYVIVCHAQKIRKIKHMAEVIKWARGYTDYKHILDKNIIRLVAKWWYFNIKQKHNKGFSYLKFN